MTAQTTHRLKTDARSFGRLWERHKRAEVRLNDREYRVGDVLELVEQDREGRPTGREVYAIVTDIEASTEYGLQPGFVMLSLEERGRLGGERGRRR